jgi:AraC-like DNA-binding protein
MKDVNYEFTDLDSEQSFERLRKTFDGVVEKESIHFDSDIAKGEVLRKSFKEGFSISKWKLNACEPIRIRKTPSPPGDAKKFTLLYVLSSADLLVRNSRKKIRINGSRNNLFWTNETMMEFKINPKQLFYAFDITFTGSWLLDQLHDADPNYKKMLDQYIDDNEQNILLEHLTIDEYKTLHDLEASMLPGKHDDLFIHAKVYALLCNFFSKLVNKKEIKPVQISTHFDQMIEAEMMILEDIKKPPTVDAIARKVNMSTSSLLRRFKLTYGKSIHEYYVEKKMDLARKMIIENQLPVKETASLLGYNQSSSFIESFTKQHGYSPGALKTQSNQFLFF